MAVLIVAAAGFALASAFRGLSRCMVPGAYNTVVHHPVHHQSELRFFRVERLTLDIVWNGVRQYVVIGLSNICVIFARKQCIDYGNEAGP